MTSRRPGIFSSTLTGLMLSAALASILYAGWKLVALPFIPFDLFDWVARMLPGGVLTAGIDLMVGAIRRLHLGDTAGTAKVAEQAMAVAQFIIAGTVAVIVFFVLARFWRRRYDAVAGAIYGLATAGCVILATRSVGHTGLTGRLASGAWVLVAFVGWGVICGWAYHRLSAAGSRAAAAAGSEPEGPAAGIAAERLDRRHFLIRLGGATAVITVTGAVVGRYVKGRYGRMMASGSKPAEGRWSAANPLPNAGAAVTPAPGTRPEFTPIEDHYRIDINTAVPHIRAEDWRLQVRGLVDRPVSFSLEEIRRHEPMHQFVTLSCISNPVGGDLIGTQRWTGVSLRQLLPELHLKRDATHLVLRAADGFYEIVSLDQIRADPRVMLTYAWDGVPLTAEHGFPLRIHIPDRYGMKQPKWIESIEAIDHWEPGYWVTRGWDRTARMKATSVIDTVGSSAGGQKVVQIGGIAHAGARGISSVEIQVDGGAWQPALLRTPMSDLTWVIWRYDWPFVPGGHEFTVRCVDGQGAAQIVTPAPPHPSGASGLFSRTRPS